MKSFAQMIEVPTNPPDVLAKSVDDEVAEDVGEKKSDAHCTGDQC